MKSPALLLAPALLAAITTAQAAAPLVTPAAAATPSATPINQTITSFILQHHYSASDTPGHVVPISATNPMDPKKDELEYVFSCADGQLFLVKYPNDPARVMTIRWKPEVRNQITYQYYHDPMAPVAREKDPFRQALTYATYTAVFKARALHLLGTVGLTPDQLSQEAAARQTMTEQVVAIDKSIADGTFHKDQFQAVATALEAYNQHPGDPGHDQATADSARAVFRAVADFDALVLAEKQKAAATYMDAIEKTFTPDQKAKLIDAYTITTRPAEPAPLRTPAEIK